ncbi:MAG: DeoR/GlpR transcriptional regulator [Rhodospirillaceae bacterium]|nr:DeoR/GlpR transcriptional regulator [Rhodospirillaceae bacterium]
MAGLGAQKKADRRNKLLEQIVQDPGIMIRDLAEKLNVSRETIRRDFDALCDSGQLQRRYGGAVVVPVGNILSFEARQDKHVPERKAIARLAHDLLRDDQVIMLAPGTTALLFALELSETKKHLTVITNGIREALTLVNNDNLRVVLAPGDVDRLEGFAWGHEATEFLSRYNADLAVFFADGLALGGVSEADSRTAGMVKTMLRQSEKNMLLIDHFRFGQQGLLQICSLADLDVVVSDCEPDPELNQQLLNNDVAFHCP